MVAGAGLLLLWGGSYPAAHFGYVLIAIMVWMVLAAIWLFRGLFLLWCSVSGRIDPIVGTRRFLYGPTIIVVAVVLAFSALPLYLRFGASRPFLADAAADVSIGAVIADQAIGLFRVSGVEVIGESQIFTETSGGFLSGGGFAYLPNGPTAPALRDWRRTVSLRSMGGDWYSWVD